MDHRMDRPGPPRHIEPSFMAGDGALLQEATRLVAAVPPRHNGRSVVAWGLVLVLASALGFVAVLGIEPLKLQLHATQHLLADANRNVIDLQRQIEALEDARTMLQGQRDGLAEQAARRQRAVAAQQAATEALHQHFSPDIDRGTMAVRQVDGDVVLDIADERLFSGAPPRLSEGGKLILRRVAPILAAVDGCTIEVGGHMGLQPVAGPLGQAHTTLWFQSCARAADVVHYLAETCRLPPTRLVAAGYADTTPLTSNQSAPGRWRNARVQVTLRLAHLEG